MDSVPFFKDASPDFVTAVVQKLKYEVFQPQGKRLCNEMIACLISKFVQIWF